MARFLMWGLNGNNAYGYANLSKNEKSIKRALNKPIKSLMEEAEKEEAKRIAKPDVPKEKKSVSHCA